MSNQSLLTASFGDHQTGGRWGEGSFTYQGLQSNPSKINQLQNSCGGGEERRVQYVHRFSGAVGGPSASGLGDAEEKNGGQLATDLDPIRFS